VVSPEPLLETPAPAPVMTKFAPKRKPATPTSPQVAPRRGTAWAKSSWNRARLIVLSWWVRQEDRTGPMRGDHRLPHVEFKFPSS
jgi:hypothetical protein